MYILGICLIIELIGGVVALIFRNQVGLWHIYQSRVCWAPALCAPCCKLGVQRRVGRIIPPVSIGLGRQALNM